MSSPLSTSGEFGVVYKGSLKQCDETGFSETIAVKTLKGFLHKELVKELLKECAKMKELNHVNVLPLRGVCLDGGPAPYIIMPFMTKGSLLEHLRQNREDLVVGDSNFKMVRMLKGNCTAGDFKAPCRFMKCR